MFILINGDTIKKYNDKPPKTFNTMEKILNRFICEKFMNEKYYENVDKNKIVFYSIHKPIKGVKIMYMIEISTDLIILSIEKKPKKTKTMNEVNTIFILENYISLHIAQTENQNKQDLFIKIFNDEMVCNISPITDEYQKDINEVINCTSKIRYTLLKNIMYCIIKICDKKMLKIIKKECD